MVSLLIDAAVVLLLATTTGYMLIVNRRLRALRSGQADMGRLIADFSRTVEEAGVAAERLQKDAAVVATRLGEEMDRAQAATADLSALTTASERAAVRLERLMREARGLGAATAGEIMLDVDPSAGPDADRPVPREEAADIAAMPNTRPRKVTEHIHRPAVSEFFARLRTIG